MNRLTLALVCALSSVLLLAGCAKRAPLATPEEENPFAQLSAPLEVRDFDVASADGYRGLFLKLSRLPDAVASHAEEDPTRLILEISGPTGGESAEQTFPGGDTLVSRVRISSTYGMLRVAIDLLADELPDYSVHTMADWVLVRFAP
jgi:hypothetical protein